MRTVLLMLNLTDSLPKASSQIILTEDNTRKTSTEFDDN